MAQEGVIRIVLLGFIPLQSVAVTVLFSRRDRIFLVTNGRRMGFFHHGLFCFRRLASFKLGLAIFPHRENSNSCFICC